MPSILFVCTGNQCRSPVASELFKEMVRKTRPASWHIASAGVWAARGRGSPTALVRAAQRNGIDLQFHRSRLLEDFPDISHFDLILTMERTQREALCVEFPRLKDRVFLLTALVGPAYDIADPINKSEEEYQWMIDEIRNLITRAVPRIVELTESSPDAQTIHESIPLPLDKAY